MVLFRRGNKVKDLKSLSYEEIKTLAEKCKKCDLAKGRGKVVFGAGPVPCNLMLIGEAPGEQEDIEGLPFVGRAGQLLTKILESINIDRKKDIYITNIVKCRPPGNRTPEKSEVDACYPYLEAQIYHVKPKIILLAGSPATKAVLKIDEGINKIRGKWFKFGERDISCMPIFHPSYLLRYPSKEKGSPKWLTWEDMKEVKGALEYLKKVKELEEK